MIDDITIYIFDFFEICKHWGYNNHIQSTSLIFKQICYIIEITATPFRLHLGHYDNDPLIYTIHNQYTDFSDPNFLFFLIFSYAFKIIVVLPLFNSPLDDCTESNKDGTW